MPTTSGLGILKSIDGIVVNDEQLKLIMDEFSDFCVMS